MSVFEVFAANASRATVTLRLLSKTDRNHIRNCTITNQTTSGTKITDSRRPTSAGITIKLCPAVRTGTFLQLLTLSSRSSPTYHARCARVPPITDSHHRRRRIGQMIGCKRSYMSMMRPRLRGERLVIKASIYIEASKSVGPQRFASRERNANVTAADSLQVRIGWNFSAPVISSAGYAGISN